MGAIEIKAAQLAELSEARLARLNAAAPDKQAAQAAAFLHLSQQAIRRLSEMGEVGHAALHQIHAQLDGWLETIDGMAEASNA